METTKKVVLYGNSLVVSAIGSSLSSHPELEALRIDAALPDSVEQLHALSPDVVIVDVHSVPPNFDLSFFQKHPGILLIGLDVMNAKITMLSSQESQVFTTDDLVRAIRARG